VTSGDIQFNGKDLLEMEIEERAREGLFLAFPVPGRDPRREQHGVLKAAVDARRKHLGLPSLSSFDFMKLARENIKACEFGCGVFKAWC